MRSRAERWSSFERSLALLTVGFLFAIPVMDKLPGPYPPEWFSKKFDGTLIDLFPGSMAVAFGLIIFGELIVPALVLIAFVRGEHRETPRGNAATGFADFALAGACLLLLALTVGSLITRDYDNAFNDFGYLVGVVVLRNFAFSTRD
jgi:hypothetical protein